MDRISTSVPCISIAVLMHDNGIPISVSCIETLLKQSPVLSYGDLGECSLTFGDYGKLVSKRKSDGRISTGDHT